ncbi:MAG: serine hydrolase, partial [Candidatus Delongbacteria bacterium]|nr:serine hydrolase [Candidatus Delongbacteria bacterium]
MKLKRLRIPILIFLLAVLFVGIIFVPKIRRALAFKEAMEMKNIEYTFINMNEYLPFRTISKSSSPFVFPKVKNIKLPSDFQYKETTYNTAKYIDSSFTQGLLVLQNDTIIYENYWRGQKEDIPHIAWSMSKSYVSALFGIAVEEGYIKSIQQTVEEYLPELKGTGFEGVKIKDVLQMSSGIKFDETYSDPKSDINKFWENFVLGRPQMKFIKKLVRYRPPGTYNEYVIINTDILAMIIARATGRNLSDYLQEKILEPIGTEFDAYWLTDGEGIELAHGGLNVCLRDFAKFGRLYLNKGNLN